jgi:hypothetical protein
MAASQGEKARILSTGLCDVKAYFSGQTSAQEASCQTFWSTLIDTQFSNDHCA